MSLTGPQGTETISLPVVVNDPEAIQILAQRDLSGTDGEALFEGITLNRAGTQLYVGDFLKSRIYPLDPDFLGATGPPIALRTDFGEELVIRGGAEGLSVTPSDSILLVAHKQAGLSVVVLPSLELRQSSFTRGEFFIQALDESTALMSSSAYQSLDIIDIRTGEPIRSLAVPRAWHFSVSRSGTQVAVLSRYGEPPALHLATLPDLQEVGRIPLPDLAEANTVAFDPRGDRAYVLGRSSRYEGAAFVLVDLIARRVLRVMGLPSSCSGFCAANPVATLRSGRYVAMETDGGAYFIDTTFDLPRFHTSVGQSVAASPTEDVVYLLSPDGLITKARVVK